MTWGWYICCHVKKATVWYALEMRQRLSAKKLVVSTYTCSASPRAMPASIRDQSVELFHVVEGALVKYLKTRLLLCAIEDALD